MFATKNRLPARVRLSEGKTISHPYFFVKYQNNKLDYCRFAIIVSKKIDNRAVMRNRMRRVLQQALQDISPKITNNIDILIIVKKSFAQETSHAIKEIVSSLLVKEGLL